MDFKSTAAKWLIAQCEPLVPTLDRAVAEQAFVAITEAEPVRTAWWFAGVVTDHILTLPPADPWRHLSARVGPTLTRGRLPRPPGLTGAVGANGVFGSLADGQDLAHASFSDPSTDVGLAGIASGITAGGAAILAFAADGWEASARASQAVYAEILSDTRDSSVAAGKFFGAASDALRWSIWRRRAYMGLGDDWTLASGFAWLWRAQELLVNVTLPVGEWDEVRRAMSAEAIDPGTYEAITGA